MKPPPLESTNCTLLCSNWLPCTIIHYSRGLNLFQGVKLTKREQYQECFTPYYHATYRPSHQTPTSHLRTLQPGGDDHRPVTATSQKRIGIGFQPPRLTAQALLTIDTILMLSYSSMWSARSPRNERIVDSIGIPYLPYSPISRSIFAPNYTGN